MDVSDLTGCHRQYSGDQERFTVHVELFIIDIVGGWGGIHTKVDWVQGREDIVLMRLILLGLGGEERPWIMLVTLMKRLRDEREGYKILKYDMCIWVRISGLIKKVKVRTIQGTQAFRMRSDTWISMTKSKRKGEGAILKHGREKKWVESKKGWGMKRKCVARDYNQWRNRKKEGIT